MSRDGRGNPGRIVLKNQPHLQLVDVLRRRRTTLRKLLDEIGLSTYSGLLNWCARMGIGHPTLQEFEAAMPPTQKVNCPQEGVVVLEPPAIVDERTGQPIDPEVLNLAYETHVLDVPSESFQKKRQTKKGGSTT